mgnify:CR=1 FL=1
MVDEVLVESWAVCSGWVEEFCINTQDYIDGHDFEAIHDSFTHNHNNKKPKVIITNTIKGKGISFMENIPSWHHGKLTEKTYQEAIEELENFRNGNK